MDFSVTDLIVKQPGDRTCTTEAIGGAHYGPVQVYMTKVSDASTADGSTGWFKIFKDDWAKIAGSSDAAADNWGTKDLNTCCGRMNVKIPSDIPAGDYLLRAEVIALHVAGSAGGAQFYMSCCMFTSFLFKFPPPPPTGASIYASSSFIHRSVLSC
jgi:cellulase